MTTTTSGSPARMPRRMDEPRLEVAEGAWRSLYTVGGAAALTSLLVVLLDIVLSILPGPATPEPGKGTVIDWFVLLQDSWFMGIRGLGFLNVVNMTLAIPLFFALYGAHRRANGAYATLAAILLSIGATVYITNNAALPMLDLGRQYAASTSESERAQLVAAGQALLARSEDFTPGSFLGFFFSEVGQIAMAIVMLRSGVFSRVTAWAGITGFVLLFVFTVWATFVPVFYDVAMLVAMVGGLSSMLWNILVARRLFQLGWGAAEE